MGERRYQKQKAHIRHAKKTRTPGAAKISTKWLLTESGSLKNKSIAHKNYLPSFVLVVLTVSFLMY